MYHQSSSSPGSLLISEEPTSLAKELSQEAKEVKKLESEDENQEDVGDLRIEPALGK